MSSLVDQASAAQSEEPASLDDLLRSAADGDRAAFGELYDRLGPRVYSLARARAGDTAAEATVMKVFLRLWRNAPRFPRQDLPAGEWAGALISSCLRPDRVDPGPTAPAESRPAHRADDA